MVSSNRGDNERASLLRELMEAYGRDVIRVVFGYVRDRHIAEDLSQDVFVKVYDHLDSFRHESSYRTWILRIAANSAKDYLRSTARKSVPVEDLGYVPGPASTEESAVAKMAGQALWDAVLRLPDRYREVIWLFYAQEMSIEEIAAMTQSTIPAIKTRLHRGRELLRKVWEGCEGHDATERSRV